MEKAKTLSIRLKVGDRFTGTLFDENKSNIGEYEGYVPKFMSGNSSDDYVNLEIDVETGMIKNWKPLTEEQLEIFKNPYSEEEEAEYRL